MDIKWKGQPCPECGDGELGGTFGNHRAGCRIKLMEIEIAQVHKPKRLLWVDDKWHNYFCRLTLEVATMSTCLRRHVGCVIVRGKQIVSTGYNGVPSKVSHCTSCPRAGLPSGTGLELCRASHAEQNAVAQAAKHGISLDGCTAYVNLQPCSNCMKSLINAGIKEVIYMEGYPDEMTHDLANDSGVSLIKFERCGERVSKVME